MFHGLKTLYDGLKMLCVNKLQSVVFGCVSVLSRGHGVLAAEEASEGAAVVEAALLGNEADGGIGGGEQQGSVTDAVLVDEVGRGHAGTLAQGIVNVFVVGADKPSQRLMVGFGIAIDVGVLHQFAQSIIQLLVLRQCLGRLRLLSLTFLGFSFLALLDLLV